MIFGSYDLVLKSTRIKWFKSNDVEFPALFSLSANDSELQWNDAVVTFATKIFVVSPAKRLI